MGDTDLDDHDGLSRGRGDGIRFLVSRLNGRNISGSTTVECLEPREVRPAPTVADAEDGCDGQARGGAPSL